MWNGTGGRRFFLSMDYDKGLYRTYARGRELSQECIDLWMRTLAEFLPRRENARILDLGSGTGRFSVHLAEHFCATVIGVEPSGRMLAQAWQTRPAHCVFYVAGSAESIPCTDSCIDAAFLSMVLHHFRDIARACDELERVLRPGGCVLVRNSFRNRLDGILFYDFFPSAKAMDNARLPDIDDVVLTFERAGLENVVRRVVVQKTDDNLRAHCERMKLKAVSSLEIISEDEFRAGVTAMEQAARTQTDPKPVMDPIDFLVFRKF